MYSPGNDRDLATALRRALGDELYNEVLEGRETAERLDVVRRLIETLPAGADLPAWFSSTDAFVYFSPREIMQGEWAPADWQQRIEPSS
jgi:hypothetical protein